MLAKIFCAGRFSGKRSSFEENARTTWGIAGTLAILFAVPMFLRANRKQHHIGQSDGSIRRSGAGS